MNPRVYGPLDSATNLYTGLPIDKQRVSTGTFASVRQVVHRETGDVFALKRAKRSTAAESAGSVEAAEAMLQREVELHLSFRHPNIVELHGYFEDADAVYSLQEYVGGGSLFGYAAQRAVD